MNLGWKNGLRTWVEVSKEALAFNLKSFRKMLSGKKMMAVVKSNAYGHEILESAKLAEKFGVDYLGVDSILEASALRFKKIKIPILVLGYTLSDKLKEASDKNIEITISSFSQLQDLKKQKIKKLLKLHIKVDTGMNRQGFYFSDKENLIKELKTLSKNFKIVGLYSHLASTDISIGKRQAEEQITEFKLWVEFFKTSGFQPICHLLATAGVLRFPNEIFDMARIGIGLYGIWPSDFLRKTCQKRIKLKPALCWKTAISEIKKVKKGSCIGYDCAFKTNKDLIVGICPVGYWHGYPRDFFSKAKVIIGRNQAQRILGLISMDMMVVDLSGLKEIRPGSEVLLFGGEFDQLTNLNNLGLVSGDSPYELVTRINPQIKRFFV